MRPAAMAPPKRVASTKEIDGNPRSAKIMVGNVVTSRSSTTRGFVSATYALALRDTKSPTDSFG